MSLSMLVGGGAECGPSNPLQNLTKQFDQDRGVQQDVAGPSHSRGAISDEVQFRSQYAPIPELQQEAARFFGPGRPAPLASQVPTGMFMPTSVGPMPMPAQSFDVSGLRDALPAVGSAQRPQMSGAANAAWVADFLAHQPGTSQPHMPIQSQAQGQAQVPTSQIEVLHDRPQSTLEKTMTMRGQSGAVPWSPMYAGYGPMIGTMSVPIQRHVVQSNQISWDKEFQSQESLLNSTVSEALPQQEQQPQQGEKDVGPPDEMARLAAQVIDSVKHEQNPKFQKSEFMSLMRQLRDGEVTVDQDNIVPKESAASGGGEVKGKGRAVVTDHDVTIQSSSSQAQVLPFYQGSEESNAEYVRQAKDPHEAYFRQENADFIEWWKAHYKGPASHTAPAKPNQLKDMMEQPEQGFRSTEAALANTTQLKNAMEKSEQDWEALQAATTSIKPVVSYQFQTNNPYLLGESHTRHHSIHMSRSQRLYESVLELEAAVQRDPDNAAAWFELGVKQQENEREAKAIQALQNATELNPTLLHAWLALSVSYTNDNHRLGTYDAVREWVLRNAKYEEIVSGSSLATDARGNFAGLIDVLIQMARRVDQQGGVDADVQVALAVLLNTTEEYAKAVDCFLTALAVRPDDWLLYNRVGATMANSGRAEDALEYYHRALELNPAYIRARFNLGISCINLRRYEDAASHILDALVLQDSDGVTDETGMNDLRGLTTGTLWDSLRTTCLHLSRADLAGMCDRRDLEEFRKAFRGA